jgi:hypothetical protein
VYGVAGALRLRRDEPPALTAGVLVVRAQHDTGLLLAVAGLLQVEDGAVGHGFDEVEVRMPFDGDDAPQLALPARGGVRPADAPVGGVVEHLAVRRVADQVGPLLLPGDEVPPHLARAVLG